MTVRCRIGSLLVVMLLTANVANAQHRWNEKPKHWYTDWLWWVGEAAIAAIQATDAHSTILARERCPGCNETNAILGKHPDRGAIIGLASVGFGLGSLLHIASWETCPDPNRASRAWHIACDAYIPGINAAVTLHAVVHNYHLASQFKSASTPSSSSVTFGHTQLVNGPTMLREGPAWTIVPRRGTEKPLFLPKQYSGCGHSLTLCIPSRSSSPSSHIELSSVQFR